MPTIITHPAVPLALGLGLGPAIISRRLLAAGVVFSIVPDLDTYADVLELSFIGHRGVTHTLLFALACGGFGAMIAGLLETKRATALWFIALCTASHPFLDAFTNGGGGMPFFWPFSHERYFMPFRVIEVSPLGIAPFFSERGMTVFASELKWVWPPAIVLGLALYLRRTARTKPKTDNRGDAA